jgi:hypothetical protein
MFSSKQLIVEHTTQKRIYGTVHSESVITRTVVAEFTQRSISPPNATRCATCMLAWCQKHEKSVLMTLRGGDISPDMDLNTIYCTCGKHVHPLAWIPLADAMPDRTNPRYIWIRYKDTHYGLLEPEQYKGWWSYSCMALKPQERKSDLEGNDWLLEWCNAWCEV